MQVHSGEKKKLFFGYANNLSASGMFIQSINPKPAGTQFKVEFTLPGREEKIECTVEVVWKRDFVPGSRYTPGMGLKFVELDSDYRNLLKRFIEQSSPTFKS